MRSSSTVASLGRRWRALLQFWIAHLWLGLASLALGIAGVVLVAVFAPERPDPANPGETEIYGWGLAAVLLSAAAIAVGLASLVARSRGSRLQRIERLSEALQEAERIIAEINREMKEGAERLAELETQTAMHEELAGLSIEKAAAIRGAIAAELGLERRRSTWRDLLFVLLGAGLTFLLERLV